MPQGRDYASYAKAIEGRRLPLAFLDMEALDANAQALSVRAAGLPMRLASKSLRCVPVMRYLLERYPAFRGLMAFSAAEAAFLHEQGFQDILIGYPTLETSEIDRCLPYIQKGAAITFMIDDLRQAKALDARARQFGCVIPVCLDIDLSTHFPLLHFGVFRSPLRTVNDVEPLLQSLTQLKGVQLVGVMGYEGQLAGVADHLPGSSIYNAFVRLLKRISARECFRRRQAIVLEVRKAGFALRFVNGGGTGSIEQTRLDSSVTELTVGSGLYAPTLFDHYRDFRHLPAMAFALPVVRQARPHIYACSGGGYIASGPIHLDKQPQPYLPEGLSLIKTLGAGEVQTSVRSVEKLELGSPLFFRHAKAGELCERFERLCLIRDGRVEAEVPTYRGQQQCFF